MARTRTIERLTARLHGASIAADWDGLERAVHALAAQLQALATGGAWNASERAALGRLRAVHDSAAHTCAAAGVVLQARLDEMGGNKEGWMAYALAGATEPGEVVR